MCYPKPGPRCSAHAAERLTRVLIECQSVTFPEGTTHEERMAIYDVLIKKKKKAEREYDATPAGMAAIQAKIDENEGERKKQLQQYLRNVKAIRTRQLKLVKAKNQKPQEVDHRNYKVDNLYERLGLHTELDSSPAARFGWSEQDSRFKQNAAVLIRASGAWMKKLSSEQINSIKWFTGDGSEVLSIHTAITQNPSLRENIHQYMLKKIDTIGSVELDRRAELIRSAFEHSPRMAKPVILYRGISSENTFDLARVVKDGEYTAPTALSATVNPGIANRFGFGKVVLEVKTSRFASPSNFSDVGPREEEIMLAPGSRYRVVNVINDVTFGWSSEYPCDGYTVVQLEEIDDPKRA